MKIESRQPPAPVFVLTFSRDEGWALVASLQAWADGNPEAVGRDKWREWATMIGRELRTVR